MSEPASGPAGLLRLCRCGCAAVILVALVVFWGGWVAGVAALRTIVPGTVGMKWQTAVGLFLAASALLLLTTPVTPVRRRVARVLALATVALGAAVLAEYVFGWRLGIDELLFRDVAGRRLGIAYPGRFAPTTASCFVLTGTAILVLDRGSWRGWAAAEILVLPNGILGAMTVVGYLYAIPSFYGPASAAKMALGTGFCFLTLSAVVLLARPRGRLVSLATTDDPGGIMMRQLLPVAVLLPLLLGWAQLQLGEHGVFGHRVGTWWLAVGTSIVFGLLITRIAARLSHYAAEGRRLKAELEQLAGHDALTGLQNRRRFNEELERAHARARRHDEQYSLLLVDLDNLKTVNDTHGHLAGDQLLQAVADVFRQRLRVTDIAARLGGDEFCLLLPATGPAGAETLADALRGHIEACRVPTARGSAGSTASIGISVVDRATLSADDALARADDAMYAAKRAGGNRSRRTPAADAEPAASAAACAVP